jgi:hypothetical protein
MVIYPDLFALDSSAIVYRVDLSVESITTSGPNTGSASLIFLKNQLPIPGVCSLNNNTGIALATNFLGIFSFNNFTP